MPRRIFLFGPPSSDSLLQQADTAHRRVLPAFARLYDAEYSGADRDQDSDVDESPRPVAWRKLMSEQDLAFGFFLNGESASLRRSQDSIGVDTDNGLADEYLDTTFTQYLSQNVDSLPASLDTRSLQSSVGSELETQDVDRSYLAANLPVKALDKLSAIPAARKIESLYPQTVSINSVVAIIAIEGPRTVTTRYGYDMDVMNLIVGDDTRSGFGITVWLNSEAAEGSRARWKPPSEAAKHLRATMMSLRVQDVVMMSNIALAIFKDDVYGSSMRGDRTSVHILHRIRRLDKNDSRYRLNLDGGDMCTASESERLLIQAARAVVGWCIDFVGWERRGYERHKRRKLNDSSATSAPLPESASSDRSSWLPGDTLEPDSDGQVESP